LKGPSFSSNSKLLLRLVVPSRIVSKELATPLALTHTYQPTGWKNLKFYFFGVLVFVFSQDVVSIQPSMTLLERDSVKMTSLHLKKKHTQVLFGTIAKY